MKILILGGDKRYLPVIETLADNGAIVSLAGFVQLDINHPDIHHLKMEDIDFKQMDAIVLPVSGTDQEGKVEAPYSDQTIYLSKQMINQTPEHCVIYTGISNTYLDEAVNEANRKIMRIFERDDIAVLNSIPTAEGALKLAIEESDRTVHSSNVMVLGFGRVGMTVSRTFSAIGANVSVCCRKPADFARAQEMALHPVPLQQLDETVKNQHIIINTIPKLVLDSEVLTKADRSSLIIDLASKPGGTDFDAAKNSGIKAIHALGLPGKTAPQTAGEIIASVLMELLSE